MATETLDIVVRQKGARTVQRDILQIGVAAEATSVALNTLARAETQAATASKTLATGAKSAAGAVGVLGGTTTGATTGLQRFGLGLGLIGGAITAGITNPLKSAITTLAEFESAIALTGVLTNVEKTSDAFKELEATALELGKTTQFTSVEAAEGLQFLALAGFDANEALSALPVTLDLAAAAGTDLGRSADIATNILKGFGLANDELGTAVDILASTFSNSNVNILQLSESFKDVGPVAAQANQTFADTAAVLGKLGDAGLQGSKSGIAFRRILINLEKDAASTESVLGGLGISILDAGGNFRSIVDIFEDIESSAITSGDKIKLFGARALAAGNIIATAAGDDLREFSSILEDDIGRASEIARTRLDTLEGSFKLFTSALDNFGIAVAGSGIADFFRDIVDLGTQLFRTLSELPGPVLTLIGIIASLAAAFGVAALAAGALSFALGALGFASVGAAAIAATTAVKAFSLALLTNPIGLIASALALATVALITFKDETLTFGDTQVTVTQIAGQAWEEFGDAVEFGLNESLNAIDKFAGDGGDAIEGFAIEVNEITFTGFLKSIAGAFAAAFKVIALFVQTSSNLLLQFKLTAGEIVSDLFSGDVSGARAAAENFQDTFLNTFDGFGEKITDEIVSGLTLPDRLIEQFGASDFVQRASQRGVTAPGETKPGPLKGDGGTPGGPIPVTPQEIATAQAALDSLTASLSPAAAATQAFRDAQVDLDMAVKAGLISQTQAAKLLDETAKESYSQLTSESNALTFSLREQAKAERELITVGTQLGLSQAEIQEGIDGVAMSFETARDNTASITREMELNQSILGGAKRGFQDFAESATNSFEIVRTGVATAFRFMTDTLTTFIATGEFSFKEFAQGAISIIQEIITQILVAIAVKAALGATGFGGGLANGGGISQGQSAAGTAFLVGERGPELFVPSTAGKVVPNDELGGAPPQVNVQVVNVDDPNSVPDAINTEAGSKAVMNVIKRNPTMLRQLAG